MDIGVSTACLYPMETEKSLVELLSIGFRTFEIFMNTESEYELSYIHKLKALLNTYNAIVYSFHFHTSGFEHTMFFSDYIARFYDSLEQYSRYFYTAAKIGAKVAVLHGGKVGMVNFDLYCERFWLLSQKAKEYGITLTLENVNLHCSQSVEFIKAIRHRIGKGEIKFTFDIKQAKRAGESAEDMLDAMGTDLINLHINDNNQMVDCLLPGNGSIDFSMLKSKLENVDYKGPCIIEVYRKNFKNLKEIMQSYQFLQNSLK